MCFMCGVCAPDACGVWRQTACKLTNFPLQAVGLRPVFCRKPSCVCETAGGNGRPADRITGKDGLQIKMGFTHVRNALPVALLFFRPFPDSDSGTGSRLRYKQWRGGIHRPTRHGRKTVFPVSAILLARALSCPSPFMKFISQPHYAVPHRFGRQQFEALPPRRRLFIPYIFEDGGRRGCPVDAGIDDEAQLVDQSGLQECAVYDASALQRERLDSTPIFSAKTCIAVRRLSPFPPANK